MIDATPALRLAAGRRLRELAHQDPAAAQRRTLRRLLRRAAHTRFGREHGFADIRSVDDYQARVPLRHYEDFWREAWQPAFPRLRDVTWPGLIPAFAQSSGTTGGPTKRIPVSRAMIRANRAAAFDTLAFHLAARPDSRVFGGLNLLLGGSQSFERLAPGVEAGDLSGIAAGRVPAWARSRAFPPRDLARIDDWEDKVAALAAAARGRDIRSVSGTPSWMLLFFEQVAPSGRLAHIWPNLELVVHGGVSFTPYRAPFERWLAGGHAELREVYPASEGFIASADRGPGEGLRLSLDHGLFFEFVRPADVDQPRPDRRWIGDVEPGVEYALALSSNAGLWSYVLGDTVRLVSLDPPRLLVTGRLSFTLNAFGEHVIVEELDAAIAAAFGSVADYAVGSTLDGARGRHVFVVEPTGEADPGEAARAIDATLRRLNADYAAHRGGGFGLGPPELRLLPPGAFAAWMRGRGKLGGQNKAPRVITDPAMLAGLLAHERR